MSKCKCPVCNGDILLQYNTPTKTFKVDDEDNIIRNSDLTEQLLNDNPYIEFRCENDNEHKIDTPEIMAWTDKIDLKFYMEGHY